MNYSARFRALGLGVFFFSVCTLYGQRYPEDFTGLIGGSSIAGPRSTANSFFIGRYEVTQREYREIMGTNPSEVRNPILPVEYVSWYDAVLYCNRRSESENLRPAYRIVKPDIDPLTWTVVWDKQADGYRLPTEQEWEYAYRIALGGGTTLADPNPAGVSALNGGVWEWCWSGDEGIIEEVRSISFGSNRVSRNGFWVQSDLLHAEIRRITAPTYRSGYVGFRVVRSDFTPPKAIQPAPRPAGIDYPVSISLRKPNPSLREPADRTEPDAENVEIKPEALTIKPEYLEIDAETLEIKE